MRTLGTAVDAKFLRSIARAAVEEAAPKELDLFDELIANNTEAQRRSDDPLAFGLDVVVAVSPLALDLAKYLLNLIWDIASGSVHGAASDLVKDSIKSKVKVWLSSGAPTTGPPELPPEIIRSLAEALRKRTLELDVPSDDANNLVRSLMRQVTPLA